MWNLLDFGSIFDVWKFTFQCDNIGKLWRKQSCMHKL